jgi:hypothetical protein
MRTGGAFRRIARFDDGDWELDDIERKGFLTNEIAQNRISRMRKEGDEKHVGHLHIGIGAGDLAGEGRKETREASVRGGIGKGLKRFKR